MGTKIDLVVTHFYLIWTINNFLNFSFFLFYFRPTGPVFEKFPDQKQRYKKVCPDVEIDKTRNT